MADITEWENLFVELRTALGGDSSPQNPLDIDAWRYFLSDFKSLSSRQKENDGKVGLSFTADDFDLFATGFGAHLRDHYENGRGINIWDVAGLKANEVRNSAVLAWLLNCHGSHGRGSLFLGALLSALQEAEDVPCHLKANLPTLVDLKQYRTRVESIPLGDMVNRVDIEIEGEGTIFIEVKIGAPETGNQLERYVERAKHKSGKTGKWAVLLLTRNKARPRDEKLHESIISVSWKEIAYIIGSKLTGQSFGDTVVRQFCKHVIRF